MAKSNTTNTIKRETWKNRQVWVARSQGRLVSWKYVKGSKLNKQKAIDLFKNNRTFSNIKKKVAKSNTTNTIKRETWKNRQVWVARSQGRLVSWKDVKGSKLNKQKATDLFKNNRTFSNIKKKVTKLTNVKETVITQQVSEKSRETKPMKKPSKIKNAQYQVSGYYNKSKIIARSMKLGSGMARTAKEAKERAWNSFLQRLDQAITGDYDADEGLKNLSKVTNLEEGWVYYE